MNVAIQGTRLALTDGIRRLVEEKLADALRPLGDTDLDPVQVHVELEHRARRTSSPNRRRDEARAE